MGELWEGWGMTPEEFRENKTISELAQKESELRLAQVENEKLKSDRWERGDLWNAYEKLRAELETLQTFTSLYKSRVANLRQALENWLSATPTNKDRKYCEISNWHACRALEALNQDNKLAEEVNLLSLIVD